jgi:UDP-N-acetylmuramate: L-alanyl-gamma-D-glutamyl-meso-diaminopimelate ligase
MKVYFLGVAGAGMSALPSLMASEGDEVLGSDGAAYPPVSTYLERQGIAFHLGFDAALVPDDIDLAVIGSSAALDLASNPELAALKARGVPMTSFPERLGRLSESRRSCVVAGSYGKSTLTALIAVMMRAAGRDPGYFIGAAPIDLPAAGHAGADPELVIEGDEYVVSGEDRRSKFLLYRADALLLSSLAHDHVNVFPTPQSYEAPFAELIGRLPAAGLLVAARGYDAIARLTRSREVVWYGVGPGPGYCAIDIEPGEVTAFALQTPTGERIPLETGLLGLHNVENIAGAAALVLEWGAARPDQLAAAVAAFHGVERRLDKKTRVSRVPAYEGFGSSYDKARSAIEALRLHFPGRPLVVVFEPHAFSWRSRPALSWYDTVFAGARQVIVLPPPGQGAATHEQVSHAEIVARIRGAGLEAEGAASAGAALDLLARRLAGDEVVLLLSSGPLAGLSESLPAWLDRRFGEMAPG